MSTFFRPGNARCPFYCRTRDETDKFNTRGREFIETLWQSNSQFLDDDALQRATLKMPPVFWELYLAQALKDAGISLQTQARTRKNQRGPDFFATSPDVWIEAVTPDLGTGPDAIEYPSPNDLAVAAIILRFRHVFEDKAKIISGYIQAGLIQPGQGTVIAISGAMLPYATGEHHVPRIVQALLGLGNLIANTEPRTREIISLSIAHSEEVEKASGAVIRIDPFLNPAYSHISAVLFSAQDWGTPPESPGIEFVLVHNDMATVRIPNGWLPVGEEYWRENFELFSIRHSPRACSD